MTTAPATPAAAAHPRSNLLAGSADVSSARPGAAPLRVDVVVPFGQLGGAQRWLLDLLDATDRLRPRALVLEHGPFVDHLRRRNVDVTVRPTGPRAPDIAAAQVAARRWIAAGPGEVVLANGVKAAAVALPAAVLAGRRGVWAKHDFSFDRALARPLGRLADAVVAPSAAVAAATGRADVTLLPPTLPDQPLAIEEDARRFWRQHGVPADGGLVAVSIGRLVPYKGNDRLIEALPAVPGWHVVVVGADDRAAPGEQQRLRRLARRLGVADRVTFTGAVPEAGRWLHGVDAVVALTRVDADGFGREGYSIVGLEALRAGRSLIGAQDSPELARMARITGRAVPPTAAGAAVGLRAVSDPSLRRRAAALGPQAVAEHPTAGRCADRLASLLAGLVGRPGAGLEGGPPITVVTSVRNEVGNLEVVERVAAQLGPDDRYLVVDDASTDGTRTRLDALAATDARIEVLDGPGRNVSAARNLAITRADTDWIATTDAGCVPADGWLTALRSAAAERAPADALVGTYEVAATSVVQRAARYACFPDRAAARHPSPWQRVTGPLFGRTFGADRLDTRSAAFTRDVWREVGGFDEQVVRASDALFGHAVQRAGGRSVLAIDACVEWGQRPTLRATARMYHGYGRGGVAGGDRVLMTRDLVRAAMLPVTVRALLRGGRIGRVLVLLAGGAYLATPLARARRAGETGAVFAAIPVMAALRDVAKASGTLRGLVGAGLASTRVYRVAAVVVDRNAR